MANNGVQIEVKGLNELISTMEKYPAISEKHVNMAIRRSLTRVLGAEKKEAPVHTGNLRDNWRLDVGRFQGTLASNAPYAKDLHDGLPLSSFPTGGTLKKWAEKKGLNPWAVAKSIARRGHLIANPFLKRAVDAERDNIDREFKDALSNITKEIAGK